jgi:hypothetical protein
MAQNRSNVSSKRSDLIGSLASTAEQNAQSAANQAAGLGLQQQDQRFTEGLQAAQALISQGIEGNIPGIVSAFQQAGININPATLQTAANRQGFSDGMDLVTKGIAAGWTDEQISASLKQNGIDPAIFGTDASGAAGSGLAGIIKSTKSAANPYDSAAAAINSSTTLTPEEKQKGVALIRELAINPQYLKQMGLKPVEDAQGNWTFVPDNSLTTPQGDVNVPTTGQGSRNGQVYAANGNLYRNNGTTTPEPVAPDKVTLKDMANLAKTDPAYQAIASSLPQQPMDWDSLWGGLDGKEGQLVKLTIGGQEVIGQVNGAGGSTDDPTRSITLADGSTLKFEHDNSTGSTGAYLNGKLIQNLT